MVSGFLNTIVLFKILKPTKYTKIKRPHVHKNVLTFTSQLDISTNHNVGSPMSLPFKFCQMIYLFKTFIILWRVFIYVFGCLVMTFEFIFSDFVLNAPYRQTVFKNALEKLNAPGFRWLKKSIETIKLYHRSFCRCYSLCFYISMALLYKNLCLWL